MSTLMMFWRPQAVLLTKPPARGLDNCFHGRCGAAHRVVRAREVCP